MIFDEIDLRAMCIMQFVKRVRYFRERKKYTADTDRYIHVDLYKKIFGNSLFVIWCVAFNRICIYCHRCYISCALYDNRLWTCNILWAYKL